MQGWWGVSGRSYFTGLCLFVLGAILLAIFTAGDENFPDDSDEKE